MATVGHVISSLASHCWAAFSLLGDVFKSGVKPLGRPASPSAFPR